MSDDSERAMISAELERIAVVRQIADWGQRRADISLNPRDFVSWAAILHSETDSRCIGVFDDELTAKLRMVAAHWPRMVGRQETIRAMRGAASRIFKRDKACQSLVRNLVESGSLTINPDERQLVAKRRTVACKMSNDTMAMITDWTTWKRRLEVITRLNDRDPNSCRIVSKGEVVIVNGWDTDDGIVQKFNTNTEDDREFYSLKDFD